MTKNPRIGFAAGWIVVFAALFCWSSHDNEIIAFALLVALVGLKRAFLISRDDECSVAGVLAFAGALHFGPVGGAITGALAALALNTGSNGAPLRKLPTALSSAVSIGFISGLVCMGLSGQPLALDSAFRATSVMPIIFPCLLAMAIVRITVHQNRQRYPDQTSYFSPAEFIAGSVLVAVIYALDLRTEIGFTYILIPTGYLARQAVYDITNPIGPQKGVRDAEYEGCLNMVKSLVAAIDARENVDGTHASKIVKITVSIAERMGVSLPEIEHLKMAALLHDVGKVWIPEHILFRPGKLAPAQYDQLKTHCELGQKILEEANLPKPISLMVRSHHERWDGNGYPDQLPGEAIPLGARILCVADVFDSMTSRRTYRTEKSVEQAVDYIRGASGSHFDPLVVEAFEKALADGELAGIMSSTDASTTQDKSGRGQAPVAGMGSEYVAMFEIAQTTSGTLNLDELLQQVGEKIEEMIPNSHCVVLLNDKAFTVGEHSKDPGDHKGDLIRIEPDHIADELCNQMPECTGLEIVRSLKRADDESETGLPSTVRARLVWGVEDLGMIELYRTDQGGFSDADLRLLLGITPQVSLAVRNALIYKHTLDSANSDALTGLHNARYLFMRLEQELNRAKRLSMPLSVLQMDLDNFKPINDNFGHQFGDKVLRDLAQLFLSQIRDYDLVCRYGGDEFVVVLPDADKERAIETARRMVLATDALDPYTDGNKQIRIGISVGVATYPEDGDNARSLISSADSGMYVEKRRRKAEAA